MGSSFILAENEWKELLRKSVPRSPSLNDAHSHPEGEMLDAAGVMEHQTPLLSHSSLPSSLFSQLPLHCSSLLSYSSNHTSFY